jgi:tetratricopeptide (TPR) repeat protein
VSNRGAVAGGTAAACLGIILAAGVLQARDLKAPIPAAADRFLYLRSGRVANRVFLSFDAIAADVYWIRTIQHYGRDRRSPRTTDRFELLQPLLDLTTTLDPHFNIAYRFGAIFLSMEYPNGPDRSDQAIALLEKGIANNPSRWQYAHDIGFIHYWYTGQFDEAARWFAAAARMPDAPEWLQPLAATTLAVGGDREGARHLLGELLSVDAEYVRDAAARGLAQLQALDAVEVLEDLVEQYARDIGAYPADWTDLIRAGRLRGIPVDPTRTPFIYDPTEHVVRLSPDSPLFPLPDGFRRHP